MVGGGLLLLLGCHRAVAPEPRAASSPEMSALAPPTSRLPGAVVPTGYRLELTLRPEARHFTGSMHIDAVVKAPTPVVWLNATALEVGAASVGGRPARVVPGGEDFIGLVPDAPLGAGAVAIDLEYRAVVDHQASRGVYAQEEGGEAYAYTFFEPLDARRAFPCFDEPGFKVPWQVTLHVKREHVALGNAPVVREVDEAEGMKRVELAVTPPLPSYLVAFVVGPFELVDGGLAAGAPVRFVVPRGRAAELGWAKEVTPRVLEALVDWSGMPYPLAKLDVAVVPRYWGTMEHPGLVAMGQPLALIPVEQATRDRRQRYANILAHELAHYWFGDLVTMAWWDDTWLNEALAEWLDLIITDAVAPQWNVRDQRVAIAVRAMEADELTSARAIRQPVVTREAISASFDSELTYFKGASVVRMFEAYVGEAHWRGAMRQHLERHRWGNASAAELFSTVREILGAETADGLASFVGQPGVPRITGTLTCAPQPVLRLTQTRSLPPDATAEVAQRWTVPVCFRYGNGREAHSRCALLTEAATEIALDIGHDTKACPTWLWLNANATGYYRTSVDAALARALLTPGSAEARQARLSVAERLMLVADLKAAVSRGAVPLDLALGLAPLVARDPNEKVAAEALKLAALRDDLLDEPSYRRAQRFQLSTFGPLARRLGWRRAPGDSDERHALRRQVLEVACRAGDGELIEEGRRLALAWLQDPPTSGLDDELVSLALSVAAWSGGQALFDRLIAAALAAPDRTAQLRVLGALGSFRDPTLAARALATVQGKQFDLRETAWIPWRLLAERETRALAWSWLQAHLDELLGGMRSDEASWLVGAVAGTFCDAEHRQGAGELLGERARRIDGAHAAVTRGLEASDRCIAEQARHQSALQRFLSAQAR